MDAEYFARLVEPAPDLSADQLERLRQILGGPIDELGSANPRTSLTERSAA